ncbi:hypothetical protein M0802_014802 [Mischocyttarus mexicanus]|nr:hypothetical protein M0802_014802 [Mischocyttarus mexicanus]
MGQGEVERKKLLDQILELQVHVAQLIQVQPKPNEVPSARIPESESRLPLPQPNATPREFPHDHLCIPKEITEQIPKFDGYNISARDFIKSCENTTTKLVRYSIQDIIQTFKSRLMGSAYRLLIGVEFHAIEEFLEAIKKTFSPRKTANQYIGEIGNLRQNPNETVMQYACRIRELETALIDSIKTEFLENSAQIINKVEIGVLERREPVKGVYFEEVVVRPEKGKATIDVVNDTDDPIIMKIPTLPIIPLKERVNPVAGDLEGGEVTSGVNSRTEKPTMGDNLSEDEEIGMLEILKDVNSYGKGKKINESIYESCGDKVDEEKLSSECYKKKLSNKCYEEKLSNECYKE